MPISSSSAGADPVRTSVRFPLHLEVHVSTPTHAYEAVTEDVSANGILFAADEVPPLESTVEFRLKMPADVMGGIDDVLLECTGRIVRHDSKDGKKLAAATIDMYTLKAEHDER